MKTVLTFLTFMFHLNCFSQSLVVDDLNESASCNIDLECSNQYAIPSFFETHVARSVVKLVTNSDCSGTLIVQRGVNANDLKGFLIIINFNVI